jgi:hypothetical protein
VRRSSNQSGDRCRRTRTRYPRSVASRRSEASRLSCGDPHPAVGARPANSGSACSITLHDGIVAILFRMSPRRERANGSVPQVSRICIASRGGLAGRSSVERTGVVAARLLAELYRDIFRVVLGSHAEAPLATHVARVLAGRDGEDLDLHVRVVHLGRLDH